MDWRSITVSAEVDIYLHDIKDEVLDMLDNDELIEELSKRDVKYEETSEKYHMIPKDYVSPYKLYRYLERHRGRRIPRAERLFVEQT